MVQEELIARNTVFFFFNMSVHRQGELLEPHASMTSTIHDIREILCQTKTTLDDFMMAGQM